MHHGRQAGDSGGSRSAAAAAGTAEGTDPQSGSSAIDAWSGKVERYLVSFAGSFEMSEVFLFFVFSFFQMSCMEVY